MQSPAQIWTKSWAKNTKLSRSLIKNRWIFYLDMWDYIPRWIADRLMTLSTSLHHRTRATGLLQKTFKNVKKQKDGVTFFQGRTKSLELLVVSGTATDRLLCCNLNQRMVQHFSYGHLLLWFLRWKREKKPTSSWIWALNERKTPAISFMISSSVEHFQYFVIKHARHFPLGCISRQWIFHASVAKRSMWYYTRGRCCYSGGWSAFFVS